MWRVVYVCSVSGVSGSRHRKNLQKSRATKRREIIGDMPFFFDNSASALEPLNILERERFSMFRTKGSYYPIEIP